jgi:hypothetical protein
MTDDHELQQATIENAVLRGTLYLTASALKKYLDSKHNPVDVDGIPMLQLQVPELIQEKAVEALERANKLLRDQGPERLR